MIWTRTLRAILAFVVLVVLHYTLRPLLAWRAEIDFLVLALLFAAVRVRPGTAALIGFAMGLIADSLSLGTFGAAALAMTMVGFAASWLKAVFFADNLVLNAFFFFVGKWAFNVVFLTTERRVHGFELFLQLFPWSALSAAVTAVAGVLILLLLRPVLEPAPA